jgi:hypothetical protein
VIPLTRSMGGHGRFAYAGTMYHTGAAGPRPLPGGTPRVTAPLPVAIPGQLPYAGMDPSDPGTWVRPWNPQSGMVARLNYDGAMVQAAQPTGGIQRGRHQRRRGYR